MARPAEYLKVDVLVIGAGAGGVAAGAAAKGKPGDNAADYAVAIRSLP